MTPIRAGRALVSLWLLGGFLSLPGLASAQPAQQVSFQGKGHLILTGELIRPDGDGPFPAVIMMSGCSGMTANYGTMSRAAKLLRESGYVTLMFDSYLPRLVMSNCADPALVCRPLASKPPGKESPTVQERAEDALSARRYLASLPFVDSKRIGLVGWSHGAISALVAWERNLPLRGALPFAAVAAYYPCCSLGSPPKTTLGASTTAPLLIFAGERDDWCPAALCQAYAEELARRQRPVSLTIYPGALHSFDGDYDGDYMGHKLGSDPVATRDSLEKLLAFLDHALKS